MAHLKSVNPTSFALSSWVNGCGDCEPEDAAQPSSCDMSIGWIDTCPGGLSGTPRRLVSVDRSMACTLSPTLNAGLPSASTAPRSFHVDSPLLSHSPPGVFGGHGVKLV